MRRVWLNPGLARNGSTVGATSASRVGSRIANHACSACNATARTCVNVVHSSISLTSSYSLSPSSVRSFASCSSFHLKPHRRISSSQLNQTQINAACERSSTTHVNSSTCRTCGSLPHSLSSPLAVHSSSRASFSSRAARRIEEEVRRMKLEKLARADITQTTPATNATPQPVAKPQPVVSNAAKPTIPGISQVSGDSTTPSISKPNTNTLNPKTSESKQQASPSSSSTSTPPPPPPSSATPSSSFPILPVLVVLGAGGAAYYFYTQFSESQPDEDIIPTDVETVPGAWGEDFDENAASAAAAGTTTFFKGGDTKDDPLALHKLPQLIKEHHSLPWYRRIWFYVRLAARGTVLAFVWVPVIALGAVMPYRSWIKIVVKMLELSGPVFIKLGQWAATRPDLFPRVVCQSLSRLQAEVRGHSYARSLATCQANFGMDLTSSDGSRLILGDKVLGSGSMGQVHEGVVVDANGNEEKVAIKILHPNIHSRVNLDLTLLYYVASAITKIPYSELQWLSIPEMLIQFTTFMGSHLDLHQEASNMKRFQYLFRNNPNISFPSPIYPFVGAQVLVQSLANGIPLGKFLNQEQLDRERMEFELDPTFHDSIATRITKAHVRRHEAAVRESQRTGGPPPLPLKQPQSSPLHTEIARLGLQMYLHMLMQDNFVHSDLHPGNILVQLPGIHYNAVSKDGTVQKPSPLLQGSIEDVVHEYSKSSSEFLKSQHVNLVILDSGLVSQLNAKNRRNFLSLFGALILRDGRLAARLMLDGAPKTACTDVEALQADMHKIVSAIPLENLGSVDLGSLLSEVMNCVRRHHVKLESDFASLVISLAIIEGIGRQLDPNLSLFHEAVPVMLKNKETRKILLETAGTKACLKLGLIVAKEELQYLKHKQEQ